MGHEHAVSDGLTLNFEIAGRSTGLVVVENANHQPARLPGQTIQVSPAARDDRRLPGGNMSVHNVPTAVTLAVSFRITLPEQCPVSLLFQRDGGVNSGMNINPVAIDMHHCQIGDPLQVGSRHHTGREIGAVRRLSVGSKRRVASVLNPPIQLDPFVAGLQHHSFVVALQGNKPERLRPKINQAFNNLTAARPAIDIITQQDDSGSLTRCMIGYSDERGIKQIASAVKIGDDISVTHRAQTNPALPKRSIIAS
jgi:hypothetical protein